MPDPQPLPALGDVVDVGSWARFSPSLAIFLDEQVRSRGLPDGPGDGLTVLLTAPAPVAVKEEPPAVCARCGADGRAAPYPLRSPA